MPDKPDTATIKQVELLFRVGNGNNQKMYMRLTGNRLPEPVDDSETPNVHISERNAAGISQREWRGWIIECETNHKIAYAKVGIEVHEESTPRDWTSTDEMDVTIYNDPDELDPTNPASIIDAGASNSQAFPPPV